MKFKRVAAAVCGAAIIAGAASFAGCEFLFGVKPKTFTKNGFSVELTTEYSRRSMDDDDIVSANTIMCYESDDILFTVSQIPRDEIDTMHVFNLEGFERFLLEDYYGKDAQPTEFKSEDGKLDGLTFSWTYTYNGYGNVQSDYIFEGESYFYEIAMVTLQSSYSSLKSDIEKIVLSCSAKDGLNLNTEITPETCDFSDMHIRLDSTYVAKQDDGGVYYTNGGMLCSTYKTDKKAGGELKTLDDVQADYEEMMGLSGWDSEDLKTADDVDCRCVIGAFTNGEDDVIIMAALYVDSKGYGYIIEYFMFDNGFADYFIADALEFAKATTFSVSE